MRSGRSLPAFATAALAASVFSAAGCREQIAADAGPAADTVRVHHVEPPGPPALPEVTLPPDPVSALAPYLVAGGPPRDVSPAFCVQFRSLPSKAESDALQQRIEAQLGLPSWAFEADLDDKGTWYRVCAGAEATKAAAEAKARQWTVEGGLLRPWMSDAKAGQAAYLIKQRPGLPARAPSRAQAALLLRGRPSAERPVFLAKVEGGFLAALTFAGPAGEDALLVGPGGQRLALAGAPETDCAPCAPVLAAASPLRRVLAAADVGPWPGEELLIEERAVFAAGGETSALIVASLEDGAVVRRAAVLLSTRQPALRVLGQARVIEGDSDAELEIGLQRLELPIVEDQLCGLKARAEVLDLSSGTPRRLDENYAAAMASAEAGGGAKPALALLEALDTLGDAETASRVCAAYLSRGRDPGLARRCIARIQRLADEERLLQAVNAAGLLAESAAALRGVVAAPFFAVASKLEADARLVAEAPDCQSAPLVADVSTRREEHLLKLAEVRLRERLNLEDLVDAVFVTGGRDFGPGTPVGELTRGWLERVRLALPARYATIEAALLPPTGAAPGVPTEVSTGNAPASGRQDHIRIELADDGPGGEP